MYGCGHKCEMREKDSFWVYFIIYSHEDILYNLNQKKFHGYRQL